MKVKAYVLMATVAAFGLAAGPKDAKPTEGLNPGDLAPRIEFQENKSDKICFRNTEGRYTLIHFWAAYDAESRGNNIRLWNKVKKLDADAVTMYSFSFDKKESIFAETIKADKLNPSQQLWVKDGEASEWFKRYNLEKGFRNFLIDSRGVIVATNVTPEKLNTYLKSI